MLPPNLPFSASVSCVLPYLIQLDSITKITPYGVTPIPCRSWQRTATPSTFRPAPVQLSTAREKKNSGTNWSHNVSTPSRTWAFSTPWQSSRSSPETHPLAHDYHTLSIFYKNALPTPWLFLISLKKREASTSKSVISPKVFTYSFCPVRMEENPFSFQRPHTGSGSLKFFLLYLFHLELALPDSPSPQISPADMHYYLF